MRLSPLLAVALLLPLSGCSTPAPQSVFDEAFEPRVTLETTKGTIVIALYYELVPATAQNFIDLVQRGFYSGTKVDRIVKGVDIQIGNAASRAGDPATLPPGRAANLPDEFHPALRHDRPGIVSMARHQPDTGSTEFLIMTAPLPAYDDTYSVFGHVVAGMEVVNAIEALEIQTAKPEERYGPPKEPVTVGKATYTPAPGGTPRYGIGLRPLVTDKTTEAGREVAFAAIATNTGNTATNFTLEATASPGWEARSATALWLPAGRTWFLSVNVMPTPNATLVGSVELVATSYQDPGATAKVSYTARLGTLGQAPRLNQSVEVEFTGMLQDGRIFDTTWPEFGKDPAYTKMGSTFRRTVYEPFSYTVGQGVTAGFDALVQRTRTGEIAIGIVQPADGYKRAGAGNDDLIGRTVIFELRVLP